MSAITARFVGSVPGRHRGSAMHEFGHMKLRQHLKHSPAFAGKGEEELICQFSRSNCERSGLLTWRSIGTLGAKGKWLDSEFAMSLRPTSTSATSARLRWIYPTVENVRESLEGYPAGGAIPNSEK